MLTWKKPCWMPWCSSWKTLKEALVVWSQHLRGSQHRCIVQWGLCDPPGDPGRLGGAKGWEWLLPSPAESCGTATTMPPGSLPFWQSLAVTAYNRRTSSRCSRYCRSSTGTVGTELRSLGTFFVSIALNVYQGPGDLRFEQHLGGVHFGVK